MALYDEATVVDNVVSLARARDLRRGRNLALMNPWAAGFWLWYAMLTSTWTVLDPKRLAI